MTKCDNVIHEKLSDMKQLLFDTIDIPYRSKLWILIKRLDDTFPVNPGNECFINASSNATFIKQRDIINSIKF